MLDARATLRPQVNYSGQHTVDIGYHVDQYELRSETNNTEDWSTGTKGGLYSAAPGDTRTQALYAQDKWQINPHWALTFGGRAEHWEANDGQNKITIGSVLSTANYKDVSENKFSPKISLSFEPQPELGFRASFGQAFRFPTVGELFQPLQNGAVSYFVQSNPNLKPEEVIAGELSAERRFNSGLVRASLFNENKFDALITQFLAVGSAIPYDTGTCTRTVGCSYTQNVEHIRTRGLELATQWQDILVSGLDLLGSATFTDARCYATIMHLARWATNRLAFPKVCSKRWQHTIKVAI